MSPKGESGGGSVELSGETRVTMEACASEGPCMAPSTEAGPRAVRECHRLFRETLGTPSAGRSWERWDEHRLKWRRETCKGRVLKAQASETGRPREDPGII